MSALCAVSASKEGGRAIDHHPVARCPCSAGLGVATERKTDLGICLLRVRAGRPGGATPNPHLLVPAHPDDLDEVTLDHPLRLLVFQVASRFVHYARSASAIGRARGGSAYGGADCGLYSSPRDPVLARSAPTLASRAILTSDLRVPSQVRVEPVRTERGSDACGTRVVGWCLAGDRWATPGRRVFGGDSAPAAGSRDPPRGVP